ncbi:MAG TPA: choice-of-anchor V domain-containing protein [Bryobacteraceae bacterium]|nr:choice-of-anchor V domain-containing protein [Bryobacteraceae bacterium]
MPQHKSVIIQCLQITTLVAVIPILIWAYPTGALHGKTTAPGDQPGKACTQCHIGSTLNGGGGSVSIAFPNGFTYTPGQTQTLTVTVTDALAVAYGFQMTARADTNPSTTQAGNFTPTDVQKVICSDDSTAPADGCPNNGLEWIDQATPYPTNSFTVQWTPPATNIGNVQLYIAANAAQEGRVGDIYSADYVLVAPPLTSGGAAPIVTSGGAVNGASFGPGIQSRSFVSIFGSNFTTADPTHWDGSISADGVFPTTLTGVTVSIDGKPAPISYVDSGQINVLAPANATTGSVNVIVSNAYGSSDPIPVIMNASSPAFFTFSPDGGRYIAAQIALPTNPTTYEYLAPDGFFGSSTASRPAKSGDIIVLYGTGFGPTTPAVDPTLIFSGAAPTANPVSVTIGGQTAQVQFAGISGAGLYQLNVVVPQGVSDGDQPVVATTSDGQSTSTQSVYITVQQ